MKRLTKEQAQWFIKALDTGAHDVIPTHDLDATMLGVNYERAKFRRIINQCTEKEFPSLEIKSGWKNEIVTVKQAELSDNKTYIEIDSTGCSSSFTAQQFKHFVHSCNKIVEWLNEQEVD